LKVNIPRNDLKVTIDGIGTPTPFGFGGWLAMNTWAVFYGSDANAEVAGDVAMLSNEITPVLKALRSKGLNVVAMHNYMTGTQPDIYFCITGAPGRQKRWLMGSRPG
jgi:hypothetical protein